jgi:CheY-like chemotaxis protein
VTALRTKPYDLVLMDVQMPEMDGLEATRVIRGMTFADGQPWIVAMTAGALAADRDACTAAGMDAYLAKPVRQAELQALLTTIPNRHKPEAVNLTELGSLFDQVDSAVAAELVEEFLADCADHLGQLTDAITAGRSADVARLAHHLKSTTALFGAAELSRLLGAAEVLAGSDGAGAELRALGPQLQEAFSQVRSVLAPSPGQNAGT